jgi:hypothetical protein
MQGGSRGDPTHPAYGLIAWGAVSPFWDVANYGDDNARVILGTMLAAACLGSDAWDAPVLKCLLANLRTTGRLPFRGNRIDMPELERRGWRSDAETEAVNPAPHYEAHLWACYLSGFNQTGHKAFLSTAEAGIRRTMEAYPDGWLYNDTSERGQLLLPLASLVRVADNPEHRECLRRVAAQLIAIQVQCVALPGMFLATDAGYYRIPQSN